MLGAAVALAPQYGGAKGVALPSGFGWDSARFPLEVTGGGGSYSVSMDPKSLVDPAIWSGPAFHVDSATGSDANSGLGASDGDFANAKRTLHSAFVAGNATGAPYRLIVKAGLYSESAFTRNGNDEPNQPVAIVGWGGAVRYRTGPWTANWSADAGGTYKVTVSATRRVFRTDVLTAEGLYTELAKAASLAECEATLNSWYVSGSTVHVNIGQAPASDSIALIRSFHGARFLGLTGDLYMENIHCEGGITGALHVDPVAARNVVGVNCSFRYSAPSNPAAPQDAVQIRRTDGLIAFFGCDASYGASDGWSFHEDGVPGMHVLAVNCSGYHNGIDPATSCNAFTTHDGVTAVDVNGRYGFSRNGTEIHCIQTTQTWMLGSLSVARDPDGTSTSFKCSNQSTMWLQGTQADAIGATSGFSIEANAGSVFTRGHQTIAGVESMTSGGTIAPF